MNKLIFIAFLSVISTNIPAYAVDYIACREMLRTKNEFIEISNKYEKLELRTKQIYDTKKDRQKWDKCTDKVKMGEGIDEEIKKMFACGENQDEEKNRRRNQGETKSRGLYFRTDEGHYYYKKALKVEGDMKRVNCPY